MTPRFTWNIPAANECGSAVPHVSIWKRISQLVELEDSGWNVDVEGKLEPERRYRHAGLNDAPCRHITRGI